MEHRRFDQLTKVLASGASRRTALRLLGGSVLGGLLGRHALDETLADDRDANCRGSCAQCERDGQCCSGRCEDGVCQCKTRGRCSHDRACCSGRCRSDGRCRRAPDPGCDGAGGSDACPPDNSSCFTDADCPSDEFSPPDEKYCRLIPDDIYGTACRCGTCKTAADCPGDRPFCPTDGLSCCACQAHADCPSDRPYCDGCNCGECRGDRDCRRGRPHCCNRGSGGYCAESDACCECQRDAHCPAAEPYCDGCFCGECTTNGHCPVDRPYCCGPSGCNETRNCCGCVHECLTDEECDPGEVCAHGCMRPCQNDGQCDSGQYCFNGLCEACYCTSDADCAPGRRCNGCYCPF